MVKESSVLLFGQLFAQLDQFRRRLLDVRVIEHLSLVDTLFYLYQL